MCLLLILSLCLLIHFMYTQAKCVVKAGKANFKPDQNGNTDSEFYFIF